MVQALVLERELLELSLETRRLRDGQSRQGRRGALLVLVQLLFPELVVAP
jgi:hypothetical protein